MRTELNIKGYWYLPSKPRKKVAGILKYLPYDKIILELIGGFDTPREFMISFGDENLKNEEVILGVDENSNKITLFNCSKFGKLNFSSSFPMVGYSVQYILEGIHLKKWSDIVFNRVEARLPLLTSWVNYSGISLSYPIDKHGGFEGFNISYNRTESKKIKANLSNQSFIKILHSCSAPDNQIESIGITQFYYFQYIPEQNKNWWELLTQVKKFRDFLSFSCQSDIDFIEISLYSKKGKKQIVKKTEILTPIRLFYIQKKPYPSPELKNKSDFLIGHYDIEELFQNIINKWYSFDEEMYPIIHHLLDSILYKPIFKSVEFLTVCQALEGFHTRFLDDKKSSKTTFEGRLKILGSKFRDVIAIQNINYKLVSNSRHYYSHLYLKDNRAVSEGEDLYYLTKKLKKLLTCCFLDILGIQGDQLKEIIDKK